MLCVRFQVGHVFILRNIFTFQVLILFTLFFLLQIELELSNIAEISSMCFCAILILAVIYFIYISIFSISENSEISNSTIFNETNSTLTEIIK